MSTGNSLPLCSHGRMLSGRGILNRRASRGSAALFIKLPQLGPECRNANTATCKLQREKRDLQFPNAGAYRFHTSQDSRAFGDIKTYLAAVLTYRVGWNRGLFSTTPSQ